MCLFQALAQSDINPPPLPTAEELQQEINKPVEPSVELVSYQNIVEGVLSWLLVADDKISNMEVISVELDEVKKQFQEHEVRQEFIVSLTLLDLAFTFYRNSC